MTHDELVKRCGAWLKRCKTHRCRLVFEETHTHLPEIPDVLGFKPMGDSVLIEVKVSRSDFLGDFKKKHRKTASLGMGSRRFYACPKGLIEPHEVPPNWGLLWVYPTMIKVMKKPRKQEKSLKSEQIFLISVLKKIDFLKPLEESLKDYTEGFKALDRKSTKKAKKRGKKNRRAIRKSV